jgi:hypothetical protein
VSPILLLASGIAYVGIWMIFLTSPARRSLRSVLFLGVTSIPLGFAGLIDGPTYWLVVGAVGLTWALGLWDLNDLLAPMPAAEARFERKLWKLQDDAVSHRRRLKLDNWEAGRTEHLAILRKAHTQASQLAPPHEEWTQLLDAVLRAFEFDIEVFSGERSMNSATASASIARWEGIGRRWEELRRRRSRFWRLAR